MADKLDEVELKALLAEEIRSAIQYDDTELAQKRARAMEYYRGEMRDTPAMVGRSSVVSRDVADTIGWMLPGIIRVFTASDQMAIFEPAKPGDEAFAEQATDYANYVFWKDNPGYRILWDATHDSLTQGNGIVKHWWDDKEECEYTEHSGLTAEQISLLLSENAGGQPSTYGDDKKPGVEIVAQKPGQPQMVLVPDERGQLVEQPVETFDIKLKRVTMNGRLRVECIEPEDFLLDRDAVCVEDARFCAHRDEKTRSDLIEMGFDKEIVDSLPADRFSNLSEEKLARDDEYRNYNDVGHESMLLIELFECYVKADVDGDGVAETIRAYYAGSQGAGELLDWEVWEDDVPFSDIPCEPVPHRWDARSITDEVIDIQRIKTVLTRQMLDNMYASNLPQREVEEGTVINPESLTTPKFGSIVWRKKGSLPSQPYAVPFVADKALLGLQHFDNVREMRTGVSRSSMALDPEALQNQTATANQNQKDAAYSQIELVARNQAELGWRRVFRQILKLIVKHQDRPRTIRLRDEWVDMDPRSWNANMDVTINVGLGTGSRDRDMMMLRQIGEAQFALIEKLAEAGLSQIALEMLPMIIETMKKAAESAGIKNPDQFFPEISPERLQQIMQQMQEQAANPPPDPKVEMEKQKLQMEAEKAQAQMQMDVQKLQIEQEMRGQEMQMEHQRKIEQIQAEMALKREQLSAELQLKRELAYAEMEVKREIGIMGASMKAEGGGTSGVHPGGNPG